MRVICDGEIFWEATNQGKHEINLVEKSLLLEFHSLYDDQKGQGLKHSKMMFRRSYSKDKEGANHRHTMIEWASDDGWGDGNYNDAGFSFVEGQPYPY